MLSWSRCYHHLIESEDTLWRSQQPATYAYPEPQEPSHYCLQDPF